MLGSGDLNDKTQIYVKSDDSNVIVHKIDVVGSASCLINAIHQAYNIIYIKSCSQAVKELIVESTLDDLTSLINQDRITFDGDIDDSNDELTVLRSEYDYIEDNILTCRAIPLLQYMFKKNIYVLYDDDGETGVIKYISDYEKSIILYISDNHFDLVGVMENGVSKTHLQSNHNFISVLNNLLSK